MANETGTVEIPLLPGIGYIGFTGITFDSIRISRVDEVRLSALAIDTLQFSPAVPEPSSLALCGIAGGVGLGAWARRRRCGRIPSQATLRKSMMDP